MREPADQTVSTGRVPEKCVSDYRFYCKLFDDMVLKGLCLARRKELNSQDGFSCSGCSKDIIINSPHRRRRAFSA